MIDRGRVTPDAGATLALFHRRIGPALWASSSVEVLRTMAPELPGPTTPPEFGFAMEWYPPPGTGVAGIRRILPSQVLDLADGGVEPRDAFPVPPDLDPDGVLAALQRRLVTAMEGLSARCGRLALSLTAGKDSRLVLAAAAVAGVDALAYTFEWSAMHACDVSTPPAVAAAAGIDHRFVRRGPADPARLALWDEHTRFHAADADREYFARGQFDALEGCGADVGGSLFEVPTHWYSFAFRDPLLCPTPEDTAALIVRELPTDHRDDVLEWARWIHATQRPWIDWRDRFLLEQRVGGWLGSIAQGVDLAPVPQLHVAACRAYLSDTLALPFPQRRKRFHQEELIRRMVPALGAIPYNAPDSFGRRMRDRVRREAREIRAQRRPDLYLAHRVRRWRGKRAL